MELNKETFDIISIKYYAFHDTKVRCTSDEWLNIECVGTKYSKLSIMERQHIAYPIMDKDMEDVKFVSFEGYAFSKTRGKKGENSRGMMQLGEFIGGLKLRYFEQGKGILIYPPTSVKLFATHSGDADKLKMARQIENDYPQFYHPYFDRITEWKNMNPVSDITDSFWICEALRVHMKYDILGSAVMKQVELMGIQSHTAKSHPLCETKMVKLQSHLVP